MADGLAGRVEGAEANATTLMRAAELGKGAARGAVGPQRVDKSQEAKAREES
jgi:hypothetical protein